MIAGDRFDPADQMIGLHRRAVQFDNEQCLDIEGVADLDEGLSRTDRQPPRAAKRPQGIPSPAGVAARATGLPEIGLILTPM